MIIVSFFCQIDDFFIYNNIPQIEMHANRNVLVQIEIWIIGTLTL